MASYASLAECLETNWVRYLGLLDTVSVAGPAYECEIRLRDGSAGRGVDIRCGYEVSKKDMGSSGSTTSLKHRDNRLINGGYVDVCHRRDQTDE